MTEILYTRGNRAHNATLILAPARMFGLIQLGFSRFSDRAMNTAIFIMANYGVGMSCPVAVALVMSERQGVEIEAPELACAAAWSTVQFEPKAY